MDDEYGAALEKTELDKYLEEKRLNRNLEIDILEYWRTNQFRFPNLSLMARDILSIPVSTVASESAFSVGGRILDQYRSSLASNVVESIICTRDWKFNAEGNILLAILICIQGIFKVQYLFCFNYSGSRIYLGRFNRGCNEYDTC